MFNLSFVFFLSLISQKIYVVVALLFVIIMRFENGCLYIVSKEEISDSCIAAKRV